jgi:Mce-associated membrane protein
MTDEGAETVANVTAVEETEHGVTTIIETAEAVGADDAIVDGETVVLTDEEHDGRTITPADKAGGVRWPLVGAIAGVFGGLLVGTGILGWQVWQQHQVKEASIEAQRAASAKDSKLVAFGPHVAKERLAQAQAAGADAVVSRGELLGGFATLVRRWTE